MSAPPFVGLGALNLRFAALATVQLAVLFGRHGHVLETGFSLAR